MQRYSAFFKAFNIMCHKLILSIMAFWNLLKENKSFKQNVIAEVSF